MTEAEERDEILMLLAYSLVVSQWQDRLEGARGLNIGAVLCDPRGMPVAWALNESTSRRDLTQHAEVRLIRGYIGKIDETELSNHSIFSTLEPCIMCAGTMAMTNVARTVFGQTDPLYGNAAAMLETYPKKPAIATSLLTYRNQIDAAFEKSTHDETIFWLFTEEAESIYGEAAIAFEAYQPTHANNHNLMEAAHSFTSRPPLLHQ